MNCVRILNLIIIFFVTYTSREKMLSFRPSHSLVHSRACLAICDLISLVRDASQSWTVGTDINCRSWNFPGEPVWISFRICQHRALVCLCLNVST